MKFAIYETKINHIPYFWEIGYDKSLIHSLKLVDSDNVVKENSLVSDQAFTEISRYLAGESQNLNIDFEMAGTEFQKLVWAEIAKIPYGKTATYGEIAKILGKPKAARAVGMACNKNPLLLVIPCHRVVGANGSLTGYAGGLDLKSQLLDLEKSNLAKF